MNLRSNHGSLPGGSRVRHHLARNWPALLLLAGLCLSLLAMHDRVQRNHAQLNEAFEPRAARVAEDVRRLMASYEYGLRGARGAVLMMNQTGQLSRENYLRYHRSRDVETEFTGARGFGYIHRLQVGGEAAFTQQQRRAGRANFSVRQLAPHGHEPWVIDFIEPLEPNAVSVGLDVASEASRRAALLLAMQTGQATLTAPITLVQASGSPLQSFLLTLPVYSPDLPVDTVSQRQAALAGWTFAPLVTNEVMRQIDLLDDSLALELRDQTAATQAQAFYRRGQDRALPDLVRSHHVALFGRHWVIKVSATPAFVAAQNQVRPLTVFGLGALASLLLSTLGAVLSLSLRRKEQSAAARARLATIVRNSADAIVGQSLDGRITLWNAAAERLFGHSEADSLGRELAEFLLPADLRHEDAALLQRVAAGERIPAFDTLRLHRSGAVIEVSVTAAPIQADDGSVIGVAKHLRDVGPQKAQERALRDFNGQLEQQVAERTAALAAARDELQRTFDAVPAKLSCWDLALQQRWANAPFMAAYAPDHQALPGAGPAQAACVASLDLPSLWGDQAWQLAQPCVELALQGFPQQFERSVSPTMAADGGFVAPARHLQTHCLPDLRQGRVEGLYIFELDVSDVVRSRELLAAALARNQALLGAITTHAMYSETDREGRIVLVNDNFCRVSGYSREQLLGQNHRILDAGFHPTEFWRHMWGLIRRGEAWRNEVCNRARDGGLYWVESVIAPLPGADGEPVGYFSLRFDITARKRAEADLLDERQRLDHILRGTHAGTWDWDISSGALTLNERWAHMLGLQLVDLQPSTRETRLRLSHPDEVARCRELMIEHLQGRSDRYEFECRLQHARGHWVWVMERGRVAQRDEHGRALRILGTTLDNSARKNAEQALLARERLMRLVIDNHPGVLAHWDASLRCTLASRSYRSWLGTDPEAMVGKTPAEIFEPETVALNLPHMQAALAGQAQAMERSRVTADGQLRHYMLHYVPDHEDSVVSGFISATIDITELKRTQLALEQRSHEAEQASVAKGEFLANMSHEIRTPLNAILGVTELLSSTGMDADQQQLLGTAQNAGRALLAIVNDVLDLSKIEAGDLRLDPHDFSAQALLQELVALYGVQAQAKGVALKLQLQAELPPLVHGDALRLRQIVTNLLSNAIKFTPQGEVRLCARRLRLGDPGADAALAALAAKQTPNETPSDMSSDTPSDELLSSHWYISVHDSGIGIESEVLARLFQAFVQADASTERHYGGSGLGLSIVRRLAGLMSGTVGALSTPGQGSEFWVSLPLAAAGAETSASSTLPRIGSLGDALVGHAAVELLLDAAEPQLATVQAAARVLGWQVTPLADEAARCRALTQTDAQTGARTSDDVATFRVWLRDQPAAASADPATDTESPGSNGQRALHELHELHELPVACCSSPARLFNALNAALAADQRAALLLQTPLDHQRLRWLEGLRLLVVDDSDINLDIARRVLLRAGASEVDTCSSGSAALALLKDQASDATQAVLMDIQMPGMDGLETTRRLRQLPGLARLPVLALTANGTGDDQGRARAAGMNDLLGKPLNLDEMVRSLRRHIELGSQQPLAVADSALGAAGEQALSLQGSSAELRGSGHTDKDQANDIADAHAWPALPGIDRAGAAERLMGDLPLWRSLLRRLLRENADWAEAAPAIPAAAAGRRALAARAHKLCGGASQIGATEVQRWAGVVESELRKATAATTVATNTGQGHSALRKAATALTSLSQALATLSAAVIEPALVGTARDAAPMPLSPAAPLSQAERQQLLALLGRQDLQALDRVEALAASLFATLGRGPFEQFNQATQDLDFPRAQQLLAASATTAAPAAAHAVTATAD